MKATFDFILFVVSIFAGGVAAVSGFGIGSLLTPLLSTQISTKLAIAVVSITHFVGTFARFWVLRRHIDKKVLLHFGILSAAGGLLGALLNSKIHTGSLTLIFGGILIVSGIVGITGLSEKVKLGYKVAWTVGAISGFLGGLVGNQGGIRSAALLGFDTSAESFVGTATAIGLIVDTVRMPIYFMNQSSDILEQWPLLLIATVGVLVGTFLGMKILNHIPIAVFKKLVSGLILMLGILMFYEGLTLI